MTQINSIFKMFGAQTYGTIVNTLDKLATVPLFLYFWDISIYGEWLILRAVPSYLAIAELGFATAAANRMSVLLIDGEKNKALGYFQAAFWVLVTVSLILTVLVFTAFSLIDIRDIFNFSPNNEYNLLLVVMFMLGYALLIFQTQLLSAAYRAVGRYVYAAYFTYHIRLCELIAVVIILVCGGGVLAAALGYLIVRLCGGLLMSFLLIRKEKWLNYGYKETSFSLIREMLPNALGFLAFPLGQAMSLQGAIFVVAHLFSPAVVALFSACRTLSRTVVQFGMQINRSVWPEMTRLCTEGELIMARKVYFSAAGSFFWLGGIGSLILFYCSPWIFEQWTAGKMELDIQLLGLLLIAALINGFWYSALSILVANDSHRKVATLYVLISSLSLPLVYLLGANFNNLGIATAIVGSELIMLIVILRFSLLQVDASIMQLIQAIAKLPLQVSHSVKKRVSRG